MPPLKFFVVGLAISAALHIAAVYLAFPLQPPEQNSAHDAAEGAELEIFLAKEDQANEEEQDEAPPADHPKNPDSQEAEEAAAFLVAKSEAEEPLTEAAPPPSRITDESPAEQKTAHAPPPAAPPSAAERPRETPLMPPAAQAPAPPEPPLEEVAQRADAPPPDAPEADDGVLSAAGGDDDGLPPLGIVWAGGEGQIRAVSLATGIRIVAVNGVGADIAIARELNPRTGRAKPFDWGDAPATYSSRFRRLPRAYFNKILPEGVPALILPADLDRQIAERQRQALEEADPDAKVRRMAGDFVLHGGKWRFQITELIK